ncbi:Gfo/Idh/MocA family protein [Brevibacillus borstelensis]|jgi:predicted dehydrogenase|uniref:Gfo/Idh/MocA family protein n=1 Tax=Brevibacillus borstelensis TaxID=45462 RepID=UPI002E1EE429|nr:Gfo/Idh/MocA family oxidoreductase [Brevibacillus borstelensis]MED2007472.1 Gfo/Idh/MocA family oxidoreductase [Brevibacillus borstelensis]
MISLGIIGTGAIATHYMQAIDWLNKNRKYRIQVCAAVNRTQESNRRASYELGIPRTYTDAGEMVERERLDGIIVSVPSTSIYSVTTSMIPYKIPLLIEKPPGVTFKQTNDMAELVGKYNTSIMVGFNRRFYSVVRQAQRVIAEAGGLLGMRMDVFERYRMLRENQYPSEKLELLFEGNSIHCIDLIRYYCGDPLMVSAFLNKESVEPFNHRYSALIVSNSNIPITFQAYWHALGNWNYELYIPDGRITFSNLEQACVQFRKKEPYSLIPEEVDTEVKPGFVEQLSYFINEVIGNRRYSKYEGKMSIYDAVYTIKLVESLQNKGE